MEWSLRFGIIFESISVLFLRADQYRSHLLFPWNDVHRCFDGDGSPVPNHEINISFEIFQRHFVEYQLVDYVFDFKNWSKILEFRVFDPFWFIVDR